MDILHANQLLGRDSHRGMSRIVADMFMVCDPPVSALSGDCKTQLLGVVSSPTSHTPFNALNPPRRAALLRPAGASGVASCLTFLRICQAASGVPCVPSVDAILLGSRQLSTYSALLGLRNKLGQRAFPLMDMDFVATQASSLITHTGTRPLFCLLSAGFCLSATRHLPSTSFFSSLLLIAISQPARSLFPQ